MGSMMLEDGVGSGSVAASRAKQVTEAGTHAGNNKMYEEGCGAGAKGEQKEVEAMNEGGQGLWRMEGVRCDSEEGEAEN